MLNRIEIKNNEITIEILQELTKVLEIPFENIVVFLTNKQVTSLNYFFITDLKMQSLQDIEVLEIEKNKYGIFIQSYGYCPTEGTSTKFLTCYELLTIKPL